MPYNISVSCYFCTWYDTISGYGLLREIADDAEAMINQHSLNAHGFASHDDAMEEAEDKADAARGAQDT